MKKQELNELEHSINNPLAILQLCNELFKKNELSRESLILNIDEQIKRMADYIKSLRRK